MQKEKGEVSSKYERIDGIKKTSGKSIYVHDLKLPRMLYGKILRSSYAHALIKKIDTSKAKSIKGVVSVITAKDISCNPIGVYGEQPVLKGDRVRCFKDEVAAVAAVTPQLAEEACRSIRVEYEPLQTVFDPFESLQPNSPRLHEHAPNNRVPGSYEFKVGDPEREIRKTEYLAEGTYRIPASAYGLLEPSCIVADFDADGKLTVWCASQTPYLLRNAISRCTGIPGHKIRIIQTDIAGGFGRNFELMPYEIIAILLAKNSGRPVKLAYTMEEEFASSPVRQSMVIKMATGCNREGLLSVVKCEVTLDSGAYTSSAFATPQFMLLGIASLYKIPNIYFRCRSVYTNNPPAGVFWGFGNTQGLFALEQQIDELAKKIGIDPVTFRTINLVKAGTTTPQDVKISSCGLRECIERATQKISIDRRKTQWEGVGIACGIHVGGGARVHRSDGGGAIVSIDDFGGVTIITGATETGTGTTTSIAIIASRELGIPIEKIKVLNADTDMGIWDTGNFAARTTFVVGNAVLEACKKLKLKLCEHASELMGCSSETVELRNGNAVCIDNPEKCIPLDRIVRNAHLRCGGTIFTEYAYYDPPSQALSKEMLGNISATYSFSTHAVRVKVDPLTGKVKILKFVAVYDVGKVIDRKNLDSLVSGAINQGLGYALTEKLEFDKGKIVTRGFNDYHVMKASQMPEEIEIHYIETEDSLGPHGAKGASEIAIVPVPAAVANAIADAIGRRITSLPITPRKILEAIKWG